MTKSSRSNKSKKTSLSNLVKNKTNQTANKKVKNKPRNIKAKDNRINKKVKPKQKFNQGGGGNIVVQLGGDEKVEEQCPSGKVCLSSVGTIFVGIMLIIIFALFLLYLQGKQWLGNIGIIQQESVPSAYLSNGVIINPSLKGNGVTLNELETISENGMVETHPRQVYKHAQRRLHDPLLAPERSNPRMSPFSINVSEVGIPINEPTRGETGPYQQVGYLQAEGEKILPLFGRQVYPGSHKWTYYTSTDQYNQIKVPVEINNKNCTGEYGCDEISDDSEVFVPAYPNRSFKATIYNLDAPRYIPFV